jgi:hypothetical protein
MLNFKRSFFLKIKRLKLFGVNFKQTLKPFPAIQLGKFMALMVESFS